MWCTFIPIGGERSLLPVANNATINTANVAPSNPDACRVEDKEVNAPNINAENVSITQDLDVGSAIHVAEAVLVEDRNSEIFLATHVYPPLPWWKQ